MSIEKPSDLHAHAFKLEFKYWFKINGYETILDQGTIIVSNQSTDDNVKQAINDYVLKEIIEFLRGKVIDRRKDFSIDSNVKIISAVNVEESRRKCDVPVSQVAELASNKYLVFFIGLALVLLMFLIVV